MCEKIEENEEATEQPEGVGIDQLRQDLAAKQEEVTRRAWAEINPILDKYNLKFVGIKQIITETVGLVPRNS